jgi:hypothetical protein
MPSLLREREQRDVSSREAFDFLDGQRHGTARGTVAHCMRRRA